MPRVPITCEHLCSSRELRGFVFWNNGPSPNLLHLGKGTRNQWKGAEVSNTLQHNNVVRRRKIAQQFWWVVLQKHWVSPSIATALERTLRDIHVQKTRFGGLAWPPRFQIGIFPWWTKSKTCWNIWGTANTLPSRFSRISSRRANCVHIAKKTEKRRHPTLVDELDTLIFSVIKQMLNVSSGEPIAHATLADT